MRRSGWTWTIVGVAGALVLALVSCGGSASSDDKVETIESALRHRRPPPPPPPPPNTGGTSGSGGSSSADAIIKAAQTPDGAAIPQPAGPNGVCAPVVQLLGFWSCPIIGQTCASTSPVRHCTCSRTDGEGSNPTWICN